MKGASVVRYKKYYTVEQWKGFDYVFIRDQSGNDVTMQEYLCNTYEVFLKDYFEKPPTSRKERFDEKFDNFILKLNNGINSLNKFMDKFSKGMNSFSMDATKHEKGIKKKPYGVLMGGGNGPDYSIITGKKPKTQKKRKKKSKKKKHRKAKQSQDRDYSFLIGKK